MSGEKQHSMKLKNILSNSNITCMYIIKYIGASIIIFNLLIAAILIRDNHILFSNTLFLCIPPTIAVTALEPKYDNIVKHLLKLFN